MMMIARDFRSFGTDHRDHRGRIQIYPLVLVPLFVGPPLGMLIHVFSLRNLTTTFRNAGRTTANPLGVHASAT